MTAYHVVLAAQWGGEHNPNHELLERWEQNQFTLLYSTDILHEYIAKLIEKQAPRSAIVQLITALLKLGIAVEIQPFHFPKYPHDPDDISFLLCAGNGAATHLISYDQDLITLNLTYSFSICQPLEFLKELRQVCSLNFVLCCKNSPGKHPTLQRRF